MQDLTTGVCFSVALSSAIGFFNVAAAAATDSSDQAARQSGTETICALFDGGVGEMCASQVQRSVGPDSTRAVATTARFHVAVSRMAKPINQYLVWHDCSGIRFRMLLSDPAQRDPGQAVASKRWISFSADRRSARDRLLQAFGRWACGQ